MLALFIKIVAYHASAAERIMEEIRQGIGCCPEEQAVMKRAMAEEEVVAMVNSEKEEEWSTIKTMRKSGKRVDTYYIKRGMKHKFRSKVEVERFKKIRERVSDDGYSLKVFKAKANEKEQLVEEYIAMKNARSELECPICLEMKKDAHCLPCGHSFCAKCTKANFGIGNECSVCGTEVVGRCVRLYGFDALVKMAHCIACP